MMTRRRAFLFHWLAAFVVKAAEQVALPRTECTDIGRADNPKATFFQYARKLAHAAVRTFQMLDSVHTYGVIKPCISERQRLIQIGSNKRCVFGRKILCIAINGGNAVAPGCQCLADWPAGASSTRIGVEPQLPEKPRFDPQLL